MVLTEKILAHFRAEALYSFLLWANDDVDTFNMYIENELYNLYHQIAKKSYYYNEKDGYIIPFMESFDMEIHKWDGEGSLVRSHSIKMACKESDSISVNDFIVRYRDSFLKIFNHRTLAEIEKYMNIPSAFPFIVEFHYRIHTAYVLVNELNKIRNRIINTTIPFINKEDEMLDNLFCNTIWHFIVNGNLIARWGESFEEFDYTVVDPFGIPKRIEANICVDKNGDMLLSQCILADYFNT